MELWRGLENLAENPGFDEKLAREFPAGAEVWSELGDPVSRREFLGILGASLALAGLGACTRLPSEKIIPYVMPSDADSMVPGIARYYASCFCLGGYAQGILVESHDGRPTQVQGNPEHPASLGGSSIFMQASLLSLYDPERSKGVKHEGLVSSWEAFAAELREKNPEWQSRKGVGLRILTGTVTSPTLAWRIRELQRLYPGAIWHSYEPLHLDRQKEAARSAFGRTFCRFIIRGARGSSYL